jgi:type II secretory pathway predicted ATPase ExeA
MALDQLKLSTNPFASATAGAHVAPPLRRALKAVWRQIGRRTKAVVVVGSAGTGKTLLLDLLERAATERGMSVQRVERGDLAHSAIGSWSDLLLIDEADLIPDATLESLLSDQATTPARSIILACRKSCMRALASPVRSAILALQPLTNTDARSYVSARAASAGRPDLFTREALDALVTAAGGSARMLHLLGGIALFFAAYAGAMRVQREHVVEALAAQVGIISDPSDEAAALLDATVPPAPAPETGKERNRRLIGGPLQWGTSVASDRWLSALNTMRRRIAVPGVGPRSIAVRSDWSERLLGGVSALLLLAIIPWWLQRHPDAFPPLAEIIQKSERAAGLGGATPQTSTADALQGLAFPKAAFGLSDANSKHKGGAGAGGLSELSITVSRLPGVALPALSTEPRAARIAPPGSSLRPNVDTSSAAALSTAPEVLPGPRPERIPAAKPVSNAEAANRARDVIGGVRAAAQPVRRKRARSEEAAAPVLTAQISAPQRELPARAVANPVVPAAIPSAPIVAAPQRKRVPNDQFASAQDIRDQATATQETASLASAARDAAQTARLARDAAATASAARDAAVSASAARDAAAAASAARDVAANAAAARDAAAAASAARDVAANAAAVRDAAASAAAAREAAATASAAMDAAAAASTAREAAATASAARDAAAVASAAKEAVNVAQAAKDVVEQVAAAKQAVEIAKDAKAVVSAAKLAGPGL